ncbi:MAG: LPS export ABC transporter periplasmic protein LptC [Rikenellaceae bacterium]
MRKFNINNCLVALLVLGSAISLLSCTEHNVTTSKVSRETLMSESSDSLTVVVSENGRPSYRFSAPLVEGYSLAREPYREFRRGVKIITYLDDSLATVDAVLTANYAINYSNLQLWEAKGDVVVVKSDGKELYTQQLFWNSTTKRIYSNVDTKILNTETGDIYNGEGFESDEEMKEWSFRKMKGRMLVDTTPTEPDSTAVETTEPKPEVAKTKDLAQQREDEAMQRSLDERKKLQSQSRQDDAQRTIERKPERLPLPGEPADSVLNAREARHKKLQERKINE